MSFWLVATIVLYFFHLFLPSLFRIPQIGLGTYVGARDNLPDLPVYGARAQRAAENFKETMPIFLAFAVLFLATGSTSQLAVNGAMVFFISRLLFLGLYIAGVPLVRSFAWTGSFIGIGMMIFALI